MAESADLELEQQRAFYAAQRTEREEEAVRAAAAGAEAAAAEESKAADQRSRALYHTLVHLIGQGVLAETFIAPALGVVSDNVRFFLANVLGKGQTGKIRIPKLKPWEQLWLIFSTLTLLPLLLLTNPITLVPIVVLGLIAALASCSETTASILPHLCS